MTDHIILTRADVRLLLLSLLDTISTESELLLSSSSSSSSLPLIDTSPPPPPPNFPLRLAALRESIHIFWTQKRHLITQLANALHEGKDTLKYLNYQSEGEKVTVKEEDKDNPSDSTATSTSPSLSRLRHPLYCLFLYLYVTDISSLPSRFIFESFLHLVSGDPFLTLVESENIHGKFEIFANLMTFKGKNEEFSSTFLRILRREMDDSQCKKLIPKWKSLSKSLVKKKNEGKRKDFDDKIGTPNHKIHDHIGINSIQNSHKDLNDSNDDIDGMSESLKKVSIGIPLSTSSSNSPFPSNSLSPHDDVNSDYDNDSPLIWAVEYKNNVIKAPVFKPQKVVSPSQVKNKIQKFPVKRKIQSKSPQSQSPSPLTLTKESQSQLIHSADQTQKDKKIPVESIQVPQVNCADDSDRDDDDVIDTPPIDPNFSSSSASSSSPIQIEKKISKSLVSSVSDSPSRSLIPIQNKIKNSLTKTKTPHANHSSAPIRKSLHSSPSPSPPPPASLPLIPRTTTAQILRDDHTLKSLSTSNSPSLSTDPSESLNILAVDGLRSVVDFDLWVRQQKLNDIFRLIEIRKERKKQIKMRQKILQKTLKTHLDMKKHKVEEIRKEMEEMTLENKKIQEEEIKAKIIAAERFDEENEKKLLWAKMKSDNEKKQSASEIKKESIKLSEEKKRNEENEKEEKRKLIMEIQSMQLKVSIDDKNTQRKFHQMMKNPTDFMLSSTMSILELKSSLQLLNSQWESEVRMKRERIVTERKEKKDAILRIQKRAEVKKSEISTTYQLAAKQRDEQMEMIHQVERKDQMEREEQKKREIRRLAASIALNTKQNAKGKPIVKDKNEQKESLVL